MAGRLCGGWTVHVLKMTSVVAKIWVVLSVGLEMALKEGAVSASKGTFSLKSGKS